MKIPDIEPTAGWGGFLAFWLKKPKGPRTDLEVKRSQRDRIFVCSGLGAMAEVPNLEGSIAALLLRVARFEDQLRQMMDLPFVEDRLENMETIVAALERAVDVLSERFEVLQRVVKGLEANIRSLERERQTILMLADRISNLETISRQETQSALEYHQIALEDMSRRITTLETAIIPLDE